MQGTLARQSRLVARFCWPRRSNFVHFSIYEPPVFFCRPAESRRCLTSTANDRHDDAPLLDSVAEEGSGANKDDQSKAWIPPHHRSEDEVNPSSHDVSAAPNTTELWPPPSFDPDSSSGTHSSDATTPIDWLESSRSMLSGSSFSEPRFDFSNQLLLTPSEALQHKQQVSDSSIAVLEYTLLSSDEIASCLVALGGRNISLIRDNPHQPRMGHAEGMLLATASSHSQLRNMADGLVRQLRRRKLHDKGVVGAQDGPEGCKRDPEEGWWVVDCQNYVVHMMDETTRRCLNLEDLWSGKDGLHRLNLLDEDAIDAYVSENPVPDEYGRRSIDLDDTIKQLQKLRWTAPHNPVVPKPKGKKRRRRRS